MRKRTFTLTEKMIGEWKENAIHHAIKLLEKADPILNSKLQLPGALVPRMRKKGHFLYEPDGLTQCVHFLQRGLAKMYCYDEHSEVPRVCCFWDSGSIILMDKMLREQLTTGDCYIELVEDSELVSITNLYSDNCAPFAELIKKCSRITINNALQQIDLFRMEPKADRYAAFHSRYVNLRGRLSLDEIGGFIGMSRTTLKRVRVGQ